MFLCIHLELLGRHAVQVDERTDHARSKYDVRRILDQLPSLFKRVLHVVCEAGDPMSEPTQCILGAVNEGASGVAEAARADVVQAC